MVRIPTVDEIQAYLNARNPVGLAGASVVLVAAGNHLTYRIMKGRQAYMLRMINPTSYRRGEWITMAEEYAILRAIEPTGLGPRAFVLNGGFSPPFLIQEFVEATRYNNLKPLTDEQLVGAARAIALLNAQPITPERFPFMGKYIEEGYRRASVVRYFRLADSLRRSPRRDVIRWTFLIMSIVRRASRLLARYERLLPAEFSFHFDGAHCGNTYWRDGRTMFLDWQQVSWRNDPTFTLVRFATSIDKKGIVPERAWEVLLNAYSAARPLPNFGELAWARLLERQVADLVWVLWDHARRGDRRPVEHATSVVPRYAEVGRLLR